MTTAPAGFFNELWAQFCQPEVSDADIAMVGWLHPPVTGHVSFRFRIRRQTARETLRDREAEREILRDTRRALEKTGAAAAAAAAAAQYLGWS